MDNISNSNIKLILEFYLKNKNGFTLNDIYNFYQPTKGYLYCLFNEIFKFYGDDLYKCGNSIDTDKRLCQYTTSYPMPSEILLTSDVFFDKSFAETLLFYYLKDHKFKSNREFIKCDFNIIKDAFGKVKQFFSIYNTKQLLIDFLIKDNNFKMFFAKLCDKINECDISINITDINTYIINKNNNKIQKICDDFNLKNNNDILKYKNIFINKFIRQHYMNFVDLIEINTDNVKVCIIKKLYHEHNIDYLSLNQFNTIKEIKINDTYFYDIIKPTIRTTTDKPTNVNEFQKLIFKILKNFIGYTRIIKNIKKTNTKNNNITNTYYQWNINTIIFYIELYKINNTKFSDNQLRNIISYFKY